MLFAASVSNVSYRPSARTNGCNDYKQSYSFHVLEVSITSMHDTSAHANWGRTRM